jgi:hypothetical protein
MIFFLTTMGLVKGVRFGANKNKETGWLFHYVLSLLDLRVADDGNGKRNFVRKRSCTYREILQLNWEFMC